MFGYKKPVITNDDVLKFQEKALDEVSLDILILTNDSVEKILNDTFIKKGAFQIDFYLDLYSDFSFFAQAYPRLKYLVERLPHRSRRMALKQIADEIQNTMEFKGFVPFECEDTFRNNTFYWFEDNYLGESMIGSNDDAQNHDWYDSFPIKVPRTFSYTLDVPQSFSLDEWCQRTEELKDEDDDWMNAPMGRIAGKLEQPKPKKKKPVAKKKPLKKTKKKTKK